MGRRESARFLAGGSAPGGTLEGGQDEADDDGADRGEHDGADEPLDRAEAQLAAQPAADDTAEDTDHDRRQAAPRVAAAYEPAAERSRDETDDDPSDEPHVHAASVAWRGVPNQPRRKASTAPTNAWAWVWWAAWRAPSMMTTRPSASRSSSAPTAERKVGADAPPSTWSTGMLMPAIVSSDAAGEAAASSSRAIVCAAATRSGQTRSDRNRSRSSGGIRTTSRMNVASASSGRPRSTSPRSRCERSG